MKIICPLRSKKWLTILLLVLGLMVLAVKLWPQKGEVTVNAAEVTPPNKGVFSGNLALDFTLEDITGQKVSLSDFIGKPIVLNFFATWCGPCQAEMPHMQKKWQEYNAKGSDLVYLLVNVGESKAVVEKFFRNKGYTMPVVFDPNSKVFAQYLFRGIPATLFINREGVIKARYNQYISAGILQENITLITGES